MVHFARALVVFSVVVAAGGTVPVDAAAQLRAHGVEAALTQVSDASMLLGGRAPRGALRGLLDLTFDIDLGALLGAPGASLHVQHQAYAGRNGSAVLGDVQGFSNIDTEPFARAGEVWLQQVIAGERVRVRLGQLDVAAEFAATANAGSFLNASFGLVPAIAGAPTYPEPARGALARVVTPLGVDAGAGAFATGGGLDPDFVIGEVAVARAAVRLALGGWRHAPPGAAAQQGWYALLDAPLLVRAEGAAGIDAFAQLGRCTAACEGVHHHAGAGLVARGLVAGARAAEQGLAVSWVRFAAGERLEAERVVEGFVATGVTNALRLQLDVQRIERSLVAARYGITLRSVVEL